jgi:uncharacterized membrane protein
MESVEALLHTAGHTIALVVEAIALLLIAIGTFEALINLARVLFNPRGTNQQRREVWLDFAQWLVAALTFQLAADLIGTSFSPTWNEIGHLGAIAAIRTFLSYFLDREVENTRKLQHEKERPSGEERDGRHT